jgi:BirA family biotin operon repressor/biotin-[acetyl-CoA-carboxylase] ligase
MNLLNCTMIGTHIIELDRVDSTNRYAAELLQRKEIAEGTVVWARDQFNGRGQNENIWISEPGMNLTFSIILHPRFLRPDQQFLLNKAVSLGILDYIRSSCIPACPVGRLHPASCIKWPNDIYIGNRKLGGILISHRIMGPILDSSIIGIGLNINQEVFSPDLPNPVSMKQVTGRDTDLRKALHGVCTGIGKCYASLQTGNPTIEKNYRDSLFGIGMWREFMAGDNRFQGRIEGVDDLGRLIIKNRSAELMLFNHKEVEILL